MQWVRQEQDGVNGHPIARTIFSLFIYQFELVSKHSLEIVGHDVAIDYGLT
jgi:hypothetical protein